MLRSTKANLHVLRAPNPLVGCRCAPGPEAKQRLKGRHGLPPTVVPEHELVQVDLELGLTDSVIRADQPLLQVADRAVRQWHHRRGAFAQVAFERLSPPNVRDARGLQALEALQAVGVDRRSPRDMVRDEIDHRGLFEVRDHRHPDPTRDIAFSTATSTMAALRPLS